MRKMREREREGERAQEREMSERAKSEEMRYKEEDMSGEEGESENERDEGTSQFCSHFAGFSSPTLHSTLPLPLPPVVHDYVHASKTGGGGEGNVEPISDPILIFTMFTFPLFWPLSMGVHAAAVVAVVAVVVDADQFESEAKSDNTADKNLGDQ